MHSASVVVDPFLGFIKSIFQFVDVPLVFGLNVLSHFWRLHLFDAHGLCHTKKDGNDGESHAAAALDELKN